MSWSLCLSHWVWGGQPGGSSYRVTSHAHLLSVRVQELQCDVSVEEDSRQEWTFTLYDFDNNGKVTREVSAPAWPPARSCPQARDRDQPWCACHCCPFS